MKTLLKILRFVGAWIGAAVALLILFAITVPANEDGEIVLSGIHSAILLVVPIVCGILATKARKKASKPAPPLSKESIDTKLPGENTAKSGENTIHKASANSLLLQRQHQIPRGLSPNDYAARVLSAVQECARAVNTAIDVFDFSSSYGCLMEGIDELIWLNESKRVYMHPSPRNELNKIHSNMTATIDDFISRALWDVRPLGLERADDLELLVSRIESDETLRVLLSDQNKGRLRKMKAEAEDLRKNEKLKKLGIEPSIDCSGFDEIEVITALETQLSKMYNKFIVEGWSSEAGLNLFTKFKYACNTSTLPLAAEVRLESLLSEYEPKFSEESVLFAIDHMEGHAFEYWCAELLRKKGFLDVQVTPGSGDQGVDILAEKEGIKYAVQCKCYSSDLGNKPIQEVHAGKSIYGCQVGAVITNRHFTQGGHELANATGVLLWDRDWIVNILQSIK